MKSFIGLLKILLVGSIFVNLITSPSYAYTTSGETFGTDGDGSGLALASGSLNHVSMSYFNSSTKQLLFSERSGSSWNTQVVDASQTTTSNTALVVTNEVPHIFYISSASKLLHAYRSSGVWQKETLSSSDSVTGGLSAITCGQDICVSFYSSTSQDLKLARLSSSGWAVSTIDSTNDVGSMNALAVTSQGLLVAAYYDATALSPKLARQQADGSWAITAIKYADYKFGIYPAVAVDSTGTIYVTASAISPSSFDRGVYISKFSTDGTLTTVEISRDYNGGPTAISFSASDSPQIVFRHLENSTANGSFASFYSALLEPSGVWNISTLTPDISSQNVLYSLPKISMAKDSWNNYLLAYPFSRDAVGTAAAKTAVQLYRALDSDSDEVPDNAETIYGTIATDADSDGDGLSDGKELFVLGSNPLSIDSDGDGVTDPVDNCLLIANSDQLDYDLDGIGNACDATPGVASSSSSSSTATSSSSSSVSSQSSSTSTSSSSSSQSSVSSSSSATSSSSSSTSSTSNSSSSSSTSSTSSSSSSQSSSTSSSSSSSSSDSSATVDTDFDGLTDEQEVNVYKTKPLIADTDGDGIEDGQEIIDGTNPLDRGSALAVLGTKFCLDWSNSLTNATGILELLNLSSQNLRTQVTLYSTSNSIIARTRFSVLAGLQRDLSLNGLTSNLSSVKSICASHDGAAGYLDGRLVYYKLSDYQDGDYQFALSFPASTGKLGTQYVTFNTNQPSSALSQVLNPVENWIQMTNLGTSQVVGTMRFYDQSGTFLGQQTLTLAAGGRFDVPAHQYGQSLVGLVQWIPQQTTIPVLMRNVRYIYDNLLGEPSFTASAQMEGVAGSGAKLLLPIDTRSSSATLELANATSSSITTSVIFYSKGGTQLKKLSLTLKAKASYHLLANSILGANTYGVVAVSSSTANSLIASVVNYAFNSDNTLQYMYSEQGVEALGSALKGGYNTYLSQNNELWVLNSSVFKKTIKLTVTRSDGTKLFDSSTLNGKTLSVAGRGVLIVNLGQIESADHYGSVTVTPSTTNSVVSWLVRTKASSYAIATPVRQ